MSKMSSQQQTAPVQSTVVQQASVVLPMPVPSSVSISAPLSSVDTGAVYMGSSMAPQTSTTISRHISVAQPQQSYLVASSAQVLPTNSASSVNSIPPSRDPVAGGLTPGGNNLTPTVVVRENNYSGHTTAPFKESQPIASDLLVERLEEISNHRDLVEDPER